MKNNSQANIANFTCTFKVEGKTEPMLKYFEKIIYPAFNCKNLIRSTNKGLTRFHLTDVHLINFGQTIALIGKHVKRTIVTLSPDFNENQGFFGDEEKKPSAPYSTFIILLDNHRIIYYRNKPGAPTLQNFQSTSRKIINEYVVQKRKELKKELKENKNIYNNKKYKYIEEFSNEVLLKKYPLANLNIVPIESKMLVEEAFKNIHKISNVRFKFFIPNNEAVDYNNFFASCTKIVKETGSKSMTQNLSSPEKVDVIENAIKTSGGKTDYKINAINENKESFTITPDSVSETIPLSIDENDTIETQTKKVYNCLKENNAVNTISEENKTLFEKFKPKFLSYFIK